jgi:hypothetical protein
MISFKYTKHYNYLQNAQTRIFITLLKMPSFEGLVKIALFISLGPNEITSNQYTHTKIT